MLLLGRFGFTSVLVLLGFAWCAGCPGDCGGDDGEVTPPDGSTGGVRDSGAPAGSGGVGSTADASQQGSSGRGGHDAGMPGDGGGSAGMGAIDGGAIIDGSTTDAGDSATADAGDAGDSGVPPIDAGPEAGIDDCVGDPCGPAALSCADGDDSYTCTCAVGYASTGANPCSDIDECLTDNGGCDPVVTCTNSEGSRTCGNCPTYHRGSGDAACIHWMNKQIPGEEAGGVAVDATGNTFVAGSTSADLDGFDNAGATDGFIVKYNALGERQWTRLFGTWVNDHVTDVATDSTGNVFAVGHAEITGQMPDPNDVFVIKHDAAGERAWTASYKTAGDDRGSAIATDGDDNVFIVGVTYNQVGFDAFLVKYNSLGQQQWSRLLRSNDSFAAHDVVVDAQGNALIVGTTHGNFDSTPDDRDLFVVKQDGAGNQLWARQVDVAVNENAWGAALDAAGNLYAAGFTTTGQFFLAKLDTDGAAQWGRIYGTTASDGANAIAADSSGNVYLAGWTEGDLDGNLNLGPPYADAFVVKYDTTGQKRWTRQFGSVSSDSSTGITLSRGELYVTGTGALPFEDNPALGQGHVFLVKHDLEGNRL